MERKIKIKNICMGNGFNELMKKDSEYREFVRLSFRRFLSGDWGDIKKKDRELNRRALENGEKLFASYTKHDARGRTKYQLIFLVNAEKIVA